MIRDGLSLYFPFLGISSSIGTVMSAAAGNAVMALVCGSICLVAIVATLALHLTDRG